MESDRSLPFPRTPPFFPVLSTVNSVHASQTDLSLPLSEAHVHFTFVTSFQSFSLCPRHCEVFRNLIGCLGDEILALRPNHELEVINWPAIDYDHIPISSSKKLISDFIRLLRENYSKRERCMRGYKCIYILHVGIYNYSCSISEVPMVIKTEW